MVSGTQFEVASSKLNALKAIQATATELSTRVPSSLLARIHSLLKSNDSEYRKLANGVRGTLTMVGTGREQAKLEKAVGVARFFQGVAPLLQAKPEEAIWLKGGGLISTMAKCYGLMDNIETQENVEEMQKAQMEQMQQMQQQELAMKQSGNNQNEGGSNVGGNQTGGQV